MERGRDRRSVSRWLALGAALALAVAFPASVRAGDDLDPEEDPELKPPDVAALDLATMAEGVDVSDDNWDSVELAIPQQLAEGKIRAVLHATKGRDGIVAFALRPESSLLLNRETLRHLRALRGQDHIGFNVLVARDRATALLIDRLPKKRTAHECAAAFGHLAWQCARMLGGERPDLDVLKAGAATLVGNDSTLHVTVGEWKEILLPALVLGRTLADEDLTTWALGEVSRVVVGKDQDPEVARLTWILALEKGTRLAATAPKEAAPILQGAFSALAAPGAFPKNDETLLYHYNAAVTAAKLAGIPVKADYKTKPETSDSLSCEIPLAVGWGVEVISGDEELVLIRGSAPGRGSVSLVVNVFFTNVNYQTEDGKILDGDSMSMILKDRLRRLEATLGKVERELPDPAPLSKTLQPRMGWQVFGQTKEGKPVRVREWGIHVGRTSEKFLVLRVFETSPADDDPELGRILETMAERRRSK